MLWTCAQCGAEVDASADRCWGCNQPKPEQEAGSQTVSLPIRNPDREGPPADLVSGSDSETAHEFRTVEPSSPPAEISAIEAWACSKCGETVDAGFLVCWSCGTSIDGVEDPSFVSADETALGADESPAITFLDDDLEPPKPDPEPRHCFRCQGPLEPGFVADFQHSSMSPSEWIAGTPQHSYWSGTWTGDRRYLIQAFRCRLCGHLDFWAGSQ
jgi:hypothetical protein